MDLVVIDGRWTYEADSALKLAVGDVVVLPPNWYKPYEWEGTVTALGSNGYSGPLKRVVRRSQQHV